MKKCNNAAEDFGDSAAGDDAICLYGTMLSLSELCLDDDSDNHNNKSALHIITMLKMMIMMTMIKKI